MWKDSRFYSCLGTDVLQLDPNLYVRKFVGFETSVLPLTGGGGGGQSIGIE